VHHSRGAEASLKTVATATRWGSSDGRAGASIDPAAGHPGPCHRERRQQQGEQGQRPG
jgi:hypothetical protein